MFDSCICFFTSSLTSHTFSQSPKFHWNPTLKTSSAGEADLLGSVPSARKPPPSHIPPGQTKVHLPITQVPKGTPHQTPTSTYPAEQARKTPSNLPPFPPVKPIPLLPSRSEMGAVRRHHDLRLVLAGSWIRMGEVEICCSLGLPRTTCWRCSTTGASTCRRC